MPFPPNVVVLHLILQRKLLTLAFRIALMVRSPSYHQLQIRYSLLSLGVESSWDQIVPYTSNSSTNFVMDVSSFSPKILDLLPTFSGQHL